MEDDLQLNTKLYGFEGIIGRHGYFLNTIIIASIALFFVFPFQLWLHSNMQTFADLFRLNEMFVKAPILLQLWFLSGIFATFVLSASNIWRRFNDINGYVNKTINISVIILFFLFSISFLVSFQFCLILGFINLVIGLIALFKCGKITKTYPYDYTKEFNWGAYLGTWIWGLFNNSYKPLWILLLGLTPWGPYYQIYCGLKGNEWAFKNKGWDDVAAFNKSQEKQATIFAILLCIVLPVLYLVLILGIVSAIVFTSTNNIKDNPEKAEQAIVKLEDSMNKFGSIYFESHVITPDENKYYVSSSDWNHYSFKEKKDILDMAASLASMERQKEYKKQNPGKYYSTSKSEEIQRTKIYSVETNHLLGEWYVDEEGVNDASFKDIIKAGMNAYKFYKDEL